MAKNKDMDFYNNFANYSDKDLILIKNNLIVKYEDVQDAWSAELAKMWDDDFDQYSARGERLIKKLNKKYASQLADIEIVFEELKEELAKREIFISELEDITDNVEEDDDENVSDVEFVRREAKKTEQYKQGLNFEVEEDEE